MKKKTEIYYREMFDSFKGHMNKSFSMELINFFKKRTVKELVFLQLKCTSEMHEKERVLEVLTNEINRRIQNRFLVVFILTIAVTFISTAISVLLNIVKN